MCRVEIYAKKKVDIHLLRNTSDHPKIGIFNKNFKEKITNWVHQLSR